jgi:hypothetical protein
MLSDQYFAFNINRKVTIAMGNLLNDIYIQTKDVDDTIFKTTKVPISYEMRQHYLERLNKAVSTNRGVNISAMLPRISFAMTGVAYDPARQRNAIHYQKMPIEDNLLKFKRLFAEVPYNFSFDVGIFTKNIEDANQIVEQIIPWFAPSFNVSLNIMPEMGIVLDFPVTLDSLSQSDNFEMGFSDNRLIQWNLSFTWKGYYYKPIAERTIITKAIAEYHNNPEWTDVIQTQTVEEDIETIFPVV